VAEGYWNGGIAGVVAFFLAVGVGLTVLARRVSGPETTLLVPVLLPVFYQVRNAFVQVPGQVVAATAVTAALVAITAIRPRRRSVDVGPAGAATSGRPQRRRVTLRG
jgi:hypothetical protein